MIVGYEQIHISDDIKTWDNLTVPVNTVFVRMMAIDNDIRFTMDDATDPSPTQGEVLLKGEPPIQFSVDNLKKIRFVRGTSNNAELSLHYYGTHDNDSDIDDGLVTRPEEYASKIDFLSGLPRFVGYDLNVHCGKGGSFAPPQKHAVIESGEDYSLVISANSGYRITTLTIDGVAYPVTLANYNVIGATLNFVSVLANHKVVAKFTVYTGAIAASALLASY